jgi:PAS domain S-box-containing protein
MKQIIYTLLLALILISLPHHANSQATTAADNKTLQLMIKDFNAGNIDSASVIADAHLNNPQLINSPEFWFYCGLINKEMFKKYEKGNPKSSFREKSSQAFQKSFVLENDTNIISDIKKNLKYLANTYYNDAIHSLKEKKADIPSGIYAFNEYIELMKLLDENFNFKQKEIEFSLILGSVYANLYEDDDSKFANEYYESAKKCYEKVLEFDANQTSAKYNLVVLETKFKTKQEKLLQRESQKKDMEIVSLNAIKELAELKLQENKLEDDANKKGLIILKNQQEKYLMNVAAEQEKKDAIAQEEKQHQKIVLWSVIAGLLIVIVFAAVVFRSSRQKEKLNKELGRKNKVIEIKNKELATLSFAVSKSTNNLLIFDANMELVWANNTFLDIHGLTLEEYKKEKGKTLFEVSTHPDIKNLLQDCINKKTGTSYESENITKNMGRRWFQSILSLIFDENDKLQNLLVIDSDITTIKLIEEELRSKNKDITDSIHYAKRIQQSILPSDNKIKELLPQSFIFYQPKDIVSGDFYWMESVENNSKIIAAAVDCTGHGVPGALLTIIGNDLLNHIVNEMNIYKPKDILKEMNAGIINRFALIEDEISREGMDMALVVIEKQGENFQLNFAGAYNSLFFIRDNELFALDAMRQHIGSIPSDQRDDIPEHSIEIKKGDIVYIFSDGYADQISGITGKKFMKGKFKELLLEIHKKPLADQKRILGKVHHEWRGETFQTDDMLVMGFQF